MITTILFILFLLIAVIVLVMILINGVTLFIKYIKKLEKGEIIKKLKRNMIVLTVVAISLVSLVWLSQRFASTPKIDGKNSVAELKKVTLNGRKEWISIRGTDRNNPVLLFLAGGPGGTQMAAVRHDLAKLENNFVVVNWDQPGSGKSYNVGKDITVDDYINDGYQLTQYLCKEFNQEKIFLMGESWGSALGIFLVDKAPELYHSFIGTGQMVDFVETEIIDYELVMKMAQEKGDTKTVDTLKDNGYPPYYGNDVTWKSADYLQYLTNSMAKNPAIDNRGYNTFRDIFSSEYGIVDKINFLRGIVTTFNDVYPQLYNIDLREDYTTINVPIYFFLGKHDINAPISLVEEYYTVLNAPAKEIVWFEHSGHSPWINESEKFVEEVLRVTKDNRQ